MREIERAFKPDGFLLSVSLLPNVNSTAYMDAQSISKHADFVNLWAFDFYNPTRNPKEADYPAPLFSAFDRKPYENGDSLVKTWIEHGVDKNKLIFGIPAFGRTWKTVYDSKLSGVPPVVAREGADPGPYSNQTGLLSYAEFCKNISCDNYLINKDNFLKLVEDPSQRFGK